MFPRFRSFWQALGHRAAQDRDLDEEVRFHVETRTEHLIRSGLPREEARRRARLEFGALDKSKEACRQSRRVNWLEDLVQDARFSLRMLRKSPGFTTVAILTLALGIGANTAIFSVIHAVLIRPLPYKNPDRVLYLYGSALDTGNFEDWRQQSKSYELFAADSLGIADLTGSGDVRRLRTSEVSADYFSLLGIQAALGRGLVPSDSEAGSDHAAVVSYHLWRTLFNGDPKLIGRTLILDHATYVVVGVLPSEIGPFPYQDVDVWLPFIPGRARYTSALARLKPGISFQSARAEAAAIAARSGASSVQKTSRPPVQVVRLEDYIVEDSRLVLLLLAGGVAFVLLIACANVANLLLARLSGRQREIAVRIALGAGRTRLARQFFVEGLLLAGMGAAFGLLVAHWIRNLLVFSIPYYVPRIDQSRVDTVALAFTLVLSGIVTILFSLAPALACSTPDLNDALKEAPRNQTNGPHRQQIPRILVVVEIALAVVMLTGAGLLIKAFLVLRPSNPGFNANNKLTMRIAIQYPYPAQRIDFLRETIERVRTLPSVRGVAAVSDLPMTGMSWLPDILIGGQTVAGADQSVQVHYRESTGNFFDLMGMPIVRGRNFSANDDERSPKVAVINEAMARRLWRDKNPIGQKFAMNSLGRPADFTVVGVVRDSRIFWNLTSARPELYVPFWQDPAGGRMSLVVHTWNEPSDIFPAVRDILHSLDRDIVISEVQTMDHILSDSIASPRYNARLFAILGALAAVLAIVGIYGVVSYAVSQRTHEIGVRMALGAHQFSILSTVIRDGMVLAFAGIVIGLGAAFVLTRFLESLLYVIKPTDPATFVDVTIMMTAVALVACLVPAGRAMRVDPMVALRHE